LAALLKRVLLAAGLVALYLAVAASWRVNPPGGLCLLAAAVILVFGAFVLARSPGTALNRAFFYFCAALAGYLLNVYVLHLAMTVGIERVKPVVWALRNALFLVPCSLVYFLYRFLGGGSRRLRLLAWAALLSMLPFMLLNVLGLYITEYQPTRWTYVPANRLGLYRASALVTMFWAALGFLLVLRRYLRPEDPRQRSSYLLFLIGWGTSMAFALTGYAAAFDRPWFPPFVGLTWMIFPLVLGFAVVRFNLFDIRIVVRRTLPYALGTALIGALYALSLWGLSTLGKHLELLTAGTNWVVLLILLALGFQPALELLQRGLDRLFFRREAELERFLAEAGARYRQADSALALARMVAADAAEELELEGAAVLLGPGRLCTCTGDCGERRLRGFPPPELPDLPGAQRAVAADGDGRLDFGAGAGELSAGLAAAGFQAVAAFGADGTRGLLLCRGKRSHLGFSPRDLGFLRALGAQADLALSRLEAAGHAAAAQRLTEAVFESMTNAVAIIDRGRLVLSCNPAFTRAFGASPGARLPPVGHEALREAGAQPVSREIASPHGVFLVSARRLDEPEGATLVVLTDVTELRRLQETDRRRSALAEIGRTVSSINHELANILAPAVVYLDKARRLCSGDEPGRALTKVEAQLRALDRLGSELRQFYRDPEILPRRVELGEAVAGAVADLEAVAGQAWRPPELVGLDAAVLADPRKLKQVLYNLLKNAWEAMAESPGPAGGSWGLRAERAGPAVRIVIHDSGPGIPEDIRRGLFQPFFTTRKGRGTGLGLAISKRIAEAHGATIAVESRVGEGARVSLLWPAAGEVPPAAGL